MPAMRRRRRAAARRRTAAPLDLTEGHISTADAIELFLEIMAAASGRLDGRSSPTGFRARPVVGSRIVLRRIAIEQHDAPVRGYDS